MERIRNLNKIKKLMNEIDESVSNPPESELHMSYGALVGSISRQIRLLIKLDLYLYSGEEVSRRVQLEEADKIVNDCLHWERNLKNER